MQIVEDYNIVIEGRGLSGIVKDRYEAIVQGMVRGIGATKVGKILMHWIKHSGTHHDWVLIVPYDKALQKEFGDCNAAQADDLWPVQIGRREVMATKVYFTPQTFMRAPCNSDPSTTPIEALVHELLHAQRSVTRIMKRVKLTGSMKDYDYEEEFFAIVFTNVYSSAHALTTVTSPASNGGLAGDHHNGRLPTAQEDPAVFMANAGNFRLVKKFCDQQESMTREMAGVPVKFNPFRTYYELKAKNGRR